MAHRSCDLKAPLLINRYRISRRIQIERAEIASSNALFADKFPQLIRNALPVPFLIHKVVRQMLAISHSRDAYQRARQQATEEIAVPRLGDDQAVGVSYQPPDFDV